jgi:hypothetical protein
MSASANPAESARTRSAGPLNKRMLAEPDVIKEIDTTKLRRFVLEYFMLGGLRTALKELVLSVYPSYKLKFLGALVAKVINRRKMPRGTVPPSFKNRAL